jgi:hypothetical protein
MMELELILHFACCVCEDAVQLTVKCVGKGLTANSRTVAAVQIPCPNCHANNQVFFEPNGTVRDVVPGRDARGRLEPSIN